MEIFFPGAVSDDVNTNGGSSTTEVYKSEFVLRDNPPNRGGGSELCLLGDFKKIDEVVVWGS